MFNDLTKYWLLLFLVLVSRTAVLGQDSEIVVQDSTCINNPLSIQNLSTKYIVDARWDFCEGNLTYPIEVNSTYNIPSSTVNIEDLCIVKDLNSYYVMGVDLTNSIFKIALGDSPNNTPISYTNEGNPGNLLKSPRRIVASKHNDEYFSFVSNLSSNSITRIHWGNSINNTVQLQDDLGNFSGELNQPFALELLKKDNSYSLIVGNHSNRKINIISFNNDLNESSPQIVNSFVAESTISKLSEIRHLNIEGTNYLFVCGQAGILLYKFGNDITSEPELLLDINQIATPRDIEIIRDMNYIYLMVVELNGRLHKLKFDYNLALTKASDLGSFDGLSNTRSIEFIKFESDWYGFSNNRDSGKALFNLNFVSSCETNTKESSQFEPDTTKYLKKGWKYFSYEAFDNNQNLYFKLDSVFVKGAEQALFVSDLNCTNRGTVFTDLSEDNGVKIINWSWDFGDPSSTENYSTNPNPVHIFSTPGFFDVTLKVDDECGVSADTTISIKIFDENDLQTDYTYPTESCQANRTLFSDKTLFIEDQPVSWLWDFGDPSSGTGNTSSLQNPTHIYNESGEYDVRLTVTGISGCQKTISNPLGKIEIIEAPKTSFSFNGTCLYDEFSFTNNTTGDHITAYQWDFGDGYFSTVASPIHNFEAGGSYIVSLTASNSYGCTNTLEQVVPVRFTPNLNFVNDLACSGKSVTLFDQSSVTDANISEHYWSLANHQIGYSQSGSGSAPTFLLTEHGAYEAMLIGASNYGCLDTLTRNINVYQSPVADFTYKNTCFGDSSLFIPQAELAPGTELLSTDWLIDGTLFSQEDVKYKFPNHGAYKVELYIRSSNLCSDNVSKIIAVHPLPDIDFVLNSFCEDQLVSVNAISDSPNDPVASFNWFINDKPVSSQESFQYEFQKSGDYDLSLNVTTQNNCFASLTKNIRINPGPTSKFDVFPSTGASPLNVQFTDRSKGAQQISYSFSRLNDDVSFEPDPTYTYYEIGSEIATQIVENEYGCTDTSTQLIDVVIPIYDVAINNVNVESMDNELMLFIGLQNNGSIIINNPVVEVILSDKIALKHKLETNLMPGSYQEYEIDFDVITTPSKSLDYICFTINEHLGSYEDINPSDNSQCINIDLGFNVLEPFPNPSSRLINIPIVLSSSNDCDLQLIEEQGNIVYSKRFPNLSAGLNTIKMDLTPYRKGMYIAVVRVSDFEVTRKIVVQ